MTAFTMHAPDDNDAFTGFEDDPFSDASYAENPVSPMDDGTAPRFSGQGDDPFADFLAMGVPAPEDDDLLTSLNDAQREAVLHGDGPLLVLAGAGSGKTRVITHRIAYLSLRRRVPPWRILAVTFTNKAAGEMRSRLLDLMGPSAASCQVSTFHALGATLLRREAEKVGLTKSFVIYDDNDTMQLVRRALKELDLVDEVKPQQVRYRIDQAKNEGKRPGDLPTSGIERTDRFIPQIYQRYEELLRQANAIDFGGLLLELVDLFKRDADVLERYRDRFRHVLVDEFQDTNPIQYELVRLLCPPGHDNLCAVGDDDQSIYRWRGADPANILSFDRHFPGTRVVKLEQNYRSDGGILDAAYAVISKNPRRAQKRLWTRREQGQPFQLILASDERDEGRQIASQIKSLAKRGVQFSDIAVFYRVNAQSRVLEESLRLSGVPYRVVRGRAFYDREEIKDAGAYLRLAINPRSDADLLRVINKPARGIGNTTLSKLQDYAEAKGVPLFDALESMDDIPSLAAAARKRLQGFADILLALSTQVAMATEAGTAVERMLELSGLVQALQAERTDEAGDRIENLKEFLNAALEFDRVRSQMDEAKDSLKGLGEEAWLSTDLTPLEAFLEQVSLLGDADDDSGAGKVSLMTLHAAKGLEFDTVFMTGMEEGIFPHVRSFGWSAQANGGQDTEEMAEERRLCYVGITRAMKRLSFSLARTRSLFGNFQVNEPSRFLRDIPPELFDFPDRKASAQKPAPISSGGMARARPPIVRRHGGMGSGFEPDPEALRRQDEDGDFCQAPPSGVRSGRSVELDPGVGRPASDGFDADFDQRPESERMASLKACGSVLPGPGDKVFHGSFGEGVVVSKSKALGPNAVLTVRFPGLGEKKILARFLKKRG